MKRIHRLLVSAFVSISVWTAIHFGWIDKHVPIDAKLKAVNAALPAWGVIALGCYALYCIGMGLYNFGDPGSAAEDLQKVRELLHMKFKLQKDKDLDIEDAKAGLRKKGFKAS